MHLNEISHLHRCKEERVLDAVSGFTNPFSSKFEDNELYFLSFGVPAKPDIAKDLIDTDDIGRKAVEEFIDSLYLKTCLLQSYKLLQKVHKQYLIQNGAHSISHFKKYQYIRLNY